MARLLRIPDMGGVDESVVLVQWVVDVGDAAMAGDVLAVVETQKAAFEMEADDDVVLVRRLFKVGDSVPMQSAYAVVADSGEGAVSDDAIESLIAAESTQKISESVSPSPAVETPPVKGATSPREGGVQPAVPAARRMARELGIDLNQIEGSGPRGAVTVADVKAHGADGSSGANAGALSPAFLAEIRADEERFAAKGSDEKIRLYREAGAEIGEGCHIGAGSLIISEKLRLGSKVVLKGCVRMECVHLDVGDLTYFGPRTQFRVRRALIAENVYFTSDVDVGGGGAMDPDAFLEIGPHGFVGEHVHLNPCSGLTIGEEVTLSRDARLMTHSFAQSVLEGYPNAFAPVHVGSFSQIGIAAVLFPGVTVGEKSIVLSNSTVVTDVPPGRLVGGIPAADIKAAVRPLSPEQVGVKALELVRAFVARLDAGGKVEVGNEEIDGDWLTWSFKGGGSRSQLLFAVAGETAPLPPAAGGVARVVCVLNQTPELAPGDACVSLLGKTFCGQPGLLSNSLREFARKRGIRLEPRCWTYDSGWL